MSPSLPSVPKAQPSAAQIKFLEASPFHQRPSIAPQGISIVHGGKPGAVGSLGSPEEYSSLQAITGSFAKIKSKELIFYVYGELRYEDVSSRPHTTEFCIYISDPDTKEIGVCRGFNELD